MSELYIKTTSLEDKGLDCEVVNLGTSNINNSSIDLKTSNMELGVKGDDGVGIKDIITVESEEENGKNEVTIVLTNNDTHKFFIRNGSAYKLSVKDKEEIIAAASEKAIITLGDKFATKDEVKTIRIKAATPSNDGLATALDVKETIEESQDRVLFFEDYEGDKKVIII